MEIIEASPKASTHIKTLQKIGYSFNSAISDIIDNSITAQSKNIHIFFDFNNSRISILDDGYGMSEGELKSNIIIGCKDPSIDREKKDLGRFGTGLKTASISMCNKVTIFSKSKDLKISAGQYDVNQIVKSDKWQVNLLDEEEIKNFATYLFDQDHSGTEVIWQDLKRYKNTTNNDLEKIMSKDSEDLRKHISLHFHKFLFGPSPINIFINNNRIMPIDPFFKNKDGYQEGKIENYNEFIDSARSKHGTIKVKAHIIPHHDFMSQEEIDEHGGLENIHKDQGLYIYRENRLIMYGGWMGLKPKFTVARLARVEVEISSNFDEEWSTNVMKTSIELPPKVKKMIKKLIQTPIERSKKEYTFRGNIEEADNFWSVKTNDRDQTVSYLVNKDNKMLAEIMKDLPDRNKILVLKYLRDMCEHLPINSILQRMSSDPKSIKQEIEDSFFDIDNLKKMIDS